MPSTAVPLKLHHYALLYSLGVDEEAPQTWHTVEARSAKEAENQAKTELLRTHGFVRLLGMSYAA